MLKQNKREKKWVELLLCQDDTPQLSSDAKNYFSGILGKNGGNAATSSYHGDDDDGDDHDDDHLDYDDGDERYDEEDDCSVGEAATVRIRPV